MGLKLHYSTPRSTMIRSKGETAIQNESQVNNALKQTKGRNRKSGYQAAKDTGASKSSVYRQLKGGKTRTEARES